MPTCFNGSQSRWTDGGLCFSFIQYVSLLVDTIASVLLRLNRHQTSTTLTRNKRKNTRTISPSLVFQTQRHRIYKTHWQIWETNTHTKVGGNEHTEEEEREKPKALCVRVQQHTLYCVCVWLSVWARIFWVGKISQLANIVPKPSLGLHKQYPFKNFIFITCIIFLFFFF